MPKPGKPGRPTKLTPETQDQICSALAEGLPREICWAGIISEMTFYRWMKRGKAAKSGKYADFVSAVKEAEAQGEVNLYRKVSAAAPHWQAPMTLMERRWPKRWARTVRTEVSGPEGAPVGVKVQVQQQVDQRNEARDALALPPLEVVEEEK